MPRARAPRGGYPAARLCVRGFTLMELVVVIVILAAVAALVVSNVDGVRDDAETTVARASMQTVAEAFLGTPATPGYLADMKFVPGFQVTAVRIHALLSPTDYPAFAEYDPVEKRGWRGPYLRNTQSVANTNPAREGRFPASGERRFADDGTFLERGFYQDASYSPYGQTDDLAAADPWGNPWVLQTPLASEFAVPTDAKRFRHARLVSAGPDGILTTPLDRLAGRVSDGTAAVRGDDLVLFLNRADVYAVE